MSVGALFSTTGNNNTVLGFGAGADLTGDNNIDIGFQVRGLTGETNTIRIGANLSQGDNQTAMSAVSSTATLGRTPSLSA